MPEKASSPAAQSSEKPGDLSPSRKRELVQRIVESQEFRRTPALRAFLLYISEQAITGRTDKLKEQVIGTEVLGRKQNYAPVNDNIVRVRAHELRERLTRYFASEGDAEPFVVTIPRGAYAPEFLPRETLKVEKQVLANDTLTEPKAPITKGSRLAVRYWITFAAILVIAVSATRVVTLMVRSDSRSAISYPSQAIRDFWGQFFNKQNQELKIVYADTSFALWQDLSGNTLNLGEYLNRKYLNNDKDKLFDLAARRVASPADIAIGVRLGTLAGELGGQANPRFARDATTEYLRYGNVVLIGSHRSNPWVEMYEPGLNFELGRDPHSGAPLFQNRSPQPHESQVYSIPAMFDTERTEEKEFTSYGVVALLKGCGDRGLAVVVEGLNMQATQAAGDMATDPERLETLLRSIGHKPGTNVVPFEALIQVTSLPAEYDNPYVIAYRLRPPNACTGNQ